MKRKKFTYFELKEKLNNKKIKNINTIQHFNLNKDKIEKTKQENLLIIKYLRGEIK